MDKKRINKCLKSYLIAKQYYEVDMDKSRDYFKQCIKILNEIKTDEKGINKDLSLIMDETETQCSVYLTNTIKHEFELPILQNNIQNNSELFEIIETGDIEQIKKYNFGDVKFNIYNNDGNTPLHSAIIFGDTLFIKHALKIGACIDQTNVHGHSLLEFACLAKDPNLINFLVYYGANMKKHLLFRENKKYFNSGYELDIILLEIFILKTSDNNNIKYLNWIFEYIDPTENISVELVKEKNLEYNISFKILISKLDNLIATFDESCRNTYIAILKEELEHDFIYKLGCPNKKIDIILYNLVPFINFNNLQLSWLLSLEIKFLILHIYKNNININIKKLKNELNENLDKTFIKTNIYTHGFIQVILSQWISKIKN